MSDGLFCDIVHDRVEATFVHRDDPVSVFMDIQPVNPGHFLVLPDAHAAGLADLDAATGARIFQVAQRMAAALRRSGLPREEVNLFLAHGEAAMQEIPHLHLHVVPRTRCDGFGLTFSPRYFTRPVRSDLEAAARQIRRALKG